MKSLLYLLRFTLVLLAFVHMPNWGFAAPAKDYVITKYGAIGDGTTLNTKAIQATIDRCSAKGGGRVVVPEGVFLSGALFLKEGVSLVVQAKGVLKGSTDQADYPQLPTRWEGEERVWTSAFINAIEVQDIEITGEGTIDGSGEVWVQQAAAARQRAADQPSGLGSGRRLGRPRLICFDKCKNVKISNLTLLNQAVWGLHILYSEGVMVSNLRITAAHNIPSSDGIDVDSSKDVQITGCYIDVNDDCISIKSGKDEDGLRVNRPSENILIEKCRFAYGHGGVAMGSETSGGIRNVTVRDCVVEADNWAPIRFKSQPSRGGVVENITYQNIVLNDTRKAFEFNMAWRMVPPVKPPAAVLPVVRNIRLINITGTVRSVGDMTGLEESPIRDVKFENCIITAQKGFVIKHARNIDLAGLQINLENGEKIIQTNVE